MSKFKYQKEFVFSEKKIDEVKQFLKDKNNTDLTQVVDDKNNTVLHQCAYQGSLVLMQEYVNYMKIYWNGNIYSLKQKKQRQSTTSDSEINYRLNQWINAKNDQGFACLHFAAFKGQIEVLQYLDRLGADCSIKTKSGLGVYHLASQGDKVKTFIYYKTKISIDEVDSRNSTPLHWAAFSGSQKVTEYLLALRAEEMQAKIINKGEKRNQRSYLQKEDWINAKDVEDQTALHLATINGNMKIVRRLLIAGADRHIKNKEGKEPIQIAQQNQFFNIEQFLNDKYTWIDHIKFFLNIKMKYQPKKRCFKMPFIFLSLSLILILGITFSLDYHEDYMGIFWTQEALFGILIVLYISLIVQTPIKRKGSYQKLKNIWLKKQIRSEQKKSQGTINSSSSRFDSKKLELNSICLWCVQFKPLRSNHCDVCNTCIEQYDHHCPWINNCVGKHNIFRFILFIILLFLALDWIFAICLQSILILLNDKSDYYIFFQIKQCIKNNTPILLIFVIVTFILWVVFVLPLFFLIIVQIGNLLLGKTTYERFSKANQSVLSTIENRSLMEQKGKTEISCSNCVFMCYSRSEQQQPLISRIL